MKYTVEGPGVLLVAETTDVVVTAAGIPELLVVSSHNTSYTAGAALEEFYGGCEWRICWRSTSATSRFWTGAIYNVIYVLRFMTV